MLNVYHRWACCSGKMTSANNSQPENYPKDVGTMEYGCQQRRKVPSKAHDITEGPWVMCDIIEGRGALWVNFFHLTKSSFSHPQWLLYRACSSQPQRQNYCPLPKELQQAHCGAGEHAEVVVCCGRSQINKDLKDQRSSFLFSQRYYETGLRGFVAEKWHSVSRMVTGETAESWIHGELGKSGLRK